MVFAGQIESFRAGRMLCTPDLRQGSIIQTNVTAVLSGITFPRAADKNKKGPQFGKNVTYNAKFHHIEQSLPLYFQNFHFSYYKWST